MNQEYLKLFKNQEEYDAAATKPVVSHLIEEVNVIIEGGSSGPDFNGHEYVDLGLPSGLLWAKMNVGANSESAYGNFYKYGKGAQTFDNIHNQYTATTENLPLELDTARLVMGGGWRMPTKTECEELINNTTVEFTTLNNVSVFKVTSRNNGNVLYFPATGNYNPMNGSYINNGKGTFPMSSTSGLVIFGNGQIHVELCLFRHSSDTSFYIDTQSLNNGGYSVRGVIEA